MSAEGRTERSNADELYLPRTREFSIIVLVSWIAWHNMNGGAFSVLESFPFAGASSWLRGGFVSSLGMVHPSPTQLRVKITGK